MNHALAVLLLVTALVAATKVSVDGPGQKDQDKGGGWTSKVNDEGKKVQELKIEAPAMTEEDQYGYTMPERYRCDACKAVVFHVGTELKKKQPKSRRMKSWEYTDVFEETCKSGFSGYGIKLINGENALSGPGLPKNQENIQAGSGAIMMSSDNWNKRLGEVCRKLIFEKIGEEEIYEMLYDKASQDQPADWAVDLSEAFCTKEVRDCTTGPKKPPPKPESEATRPRPRPRPEEKKKKKPKADSKAKNDKKASTASASSAAAGDKVDVQTFFRQLATQQGLTSDEYLTSRTAKDWEKLILALGSRILSKHSEL
jgi:pyruvate/2-oxoglutarate dehydrogenase complex dihydrolipoamide acyltransferase (E2) component